MKKFIYPVDTDQFQKIREQGKFYVDKTEKIYDLVNVKKFEYVLLARPRRFGKSLLCNTLKAYFQGQKELFEGLWIGKNETEWKKYPVLHFDMSTLKNCTIEEAKSTLEAQLRTYEAIYGRDSLSITPGTRFRDLIHNANKQAGEKTVVIIDEYDSPIMRLLYSKDLEAMRTMLREFYQQIKKEGAYLKFVFITGVTKFSQLSIFSELNNLNNISMLDDYSGICGITQDELNGVMRPCVEEYADNLGITTDEAYALLKKNYDGYHFSRNSQDVYAPFSLLRALSNNSTDYYWFESATMTGLIEHLEHFSHLNALEYDGIKVGEDDFNVACEDASTPIPLLYQTGYLTIKNYNSLQKSFILHFPNMEVRTGMIKGLMPKILKRPSIETNSLIFKITDSLFEGNISGALIALRSYIAKIPYDIITKQEWDVKQTRESFYKLLMYMAFSMLNSIVDTEVKSILGRADVVIQTKTDVFVLELKVDDTVDNALAQIDDKGYAIQYEADTSTGSAQVSRKITKCGISISSEARNITHWRAVDTNGNIIDEQMF